MPRPLSASFLFLALLVGCGTASPTVSFHTLLPLPAESPAPAPSPLRVEVMPVRIPEALQRPQLVVQTTPGRLELLEGHHWAGGLDGQLTAALRENLALLLGTEAVVAAPDGPRAKATVRVALEIQRCEATPGQGVLFKGSWMILSVETGTALAMKGAELREPVSGKGPEALAAAHGRALGALSRLIAADLRSLAK